MIVAPLQAEVVLSGALVLFTAGLMVVTYLYYDETKTHTEEMKKDRRADFKPVLKATIEEWGGIHHRFAFENTGKGSAHNVTAWWGFEHLNYEKEWKIPLITPGQRHHFYLPLSEGSRITGLQAIKDELEGEEGVLYFRYECTDALGNTVSDREELRAVGNIEKREGEILEKDELREIRMNLEDLIKAVENLK